MKNIHEDQDLIQLIQKSKRKKRWQNFFSPIIVAILAMIAMTSFYLFFFNLGPFAKNQISGIPNNHLRLNQTDIPIGQLIFDVSNTYQFNYRGENVELWVEHYQDGKQVKKERLGPTIVAEESNPSDKKNFSGSVTYGLKENRVGNNLEASTFSYAMLLNSGMGKEVIQLDDYGFDQIEGLGYSHGVQTNYQAQSFYSQSLYKIKKGAVIDLFSMTTGGILGGTTDRELQFQNVPNGFVFYLKFV